MRYSVLLPVGPQRPEQVVTFANLVRWTAAERLWQGQGLLLESHHVASWLAGMGIRVPMGFGVSLMPLRSPQQAAIEARSVALTTGHPVVAGFGPGGTGVQRGVLGQPYASPLGACREYVSIVRSLLAGETAELAGNAYSASSKLVEYHPAPVTVGLGVLRERMAALAGEIADLAITWLCSAAYLDDRLLPAVRAVPDRRLSEPATVTAIVPVALSGPGRDLTALTIASCGEHVRMPHYRDALRRGGVAVSGEDPDRDAAALVDGGVMLHGTVGEIHELLAAYRAIGVDEVVLNTSGVARCHGAKAAARDLLEILEAVPSGASHPSDEDREDDRAA